MKTCPVCGHQAEDEEVFCGECGAKLGEAVPAQTTWKRPDNIGLSGGQAPGQQTFDQQAPGQQTPGQQTFGQQTAGQQAPVWENVGVAAPPPVKKKSGKKLVPILIAGVAGIAAVAVLVMFLTGFFAPPYKKFASYQRKILMEGVVEPLLKGIDEADKEPFSTDMTLTASARDNREVDDLLDGSSISLKVDQKKNGLVASAGLTLQGDEIVEGTVSYEDGIFGFYVPRLDDTYYTVDLVQIAEELGGQDLSALENVNVNQPEIDTKLLKKLCGKYIDVILSVANEENVSQSKGEKVSMNVLRGSEKGTLYTCQPSAEEWEDMIMKLADTIEEDQDLRDLVLKLFDGQDAMLESMGLEDIGDLEDMMDEALTEAAESLRDGAESFGQGAEDSNLAWSVCVKGKNYIMLTLEMDEDGEELCLGFEKHGDDMALYSILDDEQYVAQLTREKDGGVYNGDITAYYDGGNGRKSITLSFEDVEKTKSALGFPRGVYTLEAEGVEFELNVTKGKKGGTDHSFTLPNAMTGIGDVDVTLHTTDKKATCKLPKEAEDISDYDQEELQDLASDWQDELRDITSELQDFMHGYNDYGYDDYDDYYDDYPDNYYSAAPSEAPSYG